MGEQIHKNEHIAANSALFFNGSVKKGFALVLCVCECLMDLLEKFFFFFSDFKIFN